MRTLVLSLALLFALAVPGTLAGQSLPPVHVTIVPRAGVLTQAVPFEREFNTFGPAHYQVWRYRYQPDLVWGAAADLTMDVLAVGVRLEANYAPSLRIEQEKGSLGPDVFEDATGAVTTATIAAIVQPLRTCLGALCPRLLLGGGVKRYHFDAELLSDDIVFPLAEDQTRATLQVGIGVVARSSRISLIAEVNDYSNRVGLFHDAGESRRRVHDTIATLGLALHLR